LSSREKLARTLYDHIHGMMTRNGALSKSGTTRDGRTFLEEGAMTSVIHVTHGEAGFVPEREVPLTEYNRRALARRGWVGRP